VAGDGESYVTKSFIISKFHKIILGGKQAGNMHRGGWEIHTKLFKRTWHKWENWQSWRRWEDNIKIGLQETGWEGVDWIHVAGRMVQ